METSPPSPAPDPQYGTVSMDRHIRGFDALDAKIL
jgi:hypothetical protein